MKCKYDKCDGSGYTIGNECGQEYEDPCDCLIEEICNICDNSWGNHRATDLKCPGYTKKSFLDTVFSNCEIHLEALVTNPRTCKRGTKGCIKSHEKGV